MSYMVQLYEEHTSPNQLDEQTNSVVLELANTER